MPSFNTPSADPGSCPQKSALVIHSGGMDSTLCLAMAAEEFGHDRVLSLSFSYSQRHAPELIGAKRICSDWKIDHAVIDLNCLKEITHDALLDPSVPILFEPGKEPNTLVVGRNGLMAHLGGIYADRCGAGCIYMGVMELEEANSGYRDCSRKYMDLQQEILRIDLGNPNFEIRTPLISLTKKQTLEKAEELGILGYLLKETISCYEGYPGPGCRKCPACILRNRGIEEFLEERPLFEMPYPFSFETDSICHPYSDREEDR